MGSQEVTGSQKVALELFGGLASSYELALDLATLGQDRRWKAWIARKVGAGRAEAVLDVGAGTLLLEERHFSKARSVVAVDLTQEMARAGQSKHLPNVPLIVNGDAEALPFASGTFDVIVSCYVPKYVNLPKFASELGRVVKPGGRVALYDFVRPRGAFAPILNFYLRGVLRAAGILLGWAGRKEAFTFKNLASIVNGATWNLALPDIMEAVGFRTEAFESLTGGVVNAYSGVRKGIA